MLISNSIPFSSGFPNLTDFFQDKHKIISHRTANLSLNSFSDFSKDNGLIKNSSTANVVDKLQPSDDILSLLSNFDHDEDKRPKNYDFDFSPRNYSSFDGAANSLDHFSVDATLNSSFLPNSKDETSLLDTFLSFDDKFKSLQESLVPIIEPSSNTSTPGLNDTTTSDTTGFNINLRWVNIF